MTMDILSKCPCCMLNTNNQVFNSTDIQVMDVELCYDKSFRHKIYRNRTSLDQLDVPNVRTVKKNDKDPLSMLLKYLSPCFLVK